MSEFDGQYTTDWPAVLAKRTQHITGSIIRELLKITQQPDVISFAGGLPASELFPVREFREACEFILDQVPERALQYGVTQGYVQLREYLAEKVQKYGVPATTDNTLVTNGSQQALDLIGRTFIDEGDVIVTESPTYLGAIQAWRLYNPTFVTVPIDQQGMRVDLIEAAVGGKKPKFIYVLPNFHNPAGTTLPLERREKLVEVAAKLGAFIVEDDPYGELRFEGQDMPPIVSLHKENVLYLSTFSKTLAPGIRLGWIIAPEAVTNKLVLTKEGTDLHTSTFVQYIANDICQRGIIKRHVQKIRSAYRERRDVMLAALEREFPEGSTWTHPEGGLFLWVWLPEQIDAEQLFHKALEEKVAFVPGYVFYPNGGGRNTMRLNFSCMGPDKIDEGIRRLGRAIKRELG
ncbi:MAG: PLP-dependent aminotransferase family protein [Anaerolineae bacterium]|nr:PLP-dependent aminotransferase family protein [Anaerolineae bacterium]